MLALRVAWNEARCAAWRLGLAGALVGLVPAAVHDLGPRVPLAPPHPNYCLAGLVECAPGDRVWAPFLEVDRLAGERVEVHHGGRSYILLGGPVAAVERAGQALGIVGRWDGDKVIEVDDLTVYGPASIKPQLGAAVLGGWCLFAALYVWRRRG
jgi:hypothetical protein